MLLYVASESAQQTRRKYLDDEYNDRTLVTISVLPPNLLNKLLLQLGLMDVINSYIGSVSGGTRGISGGQQKRLSFATEVRVWAGRVSV